MNDFLAAGGPCSLKRNDRFRVLRHRDQLRSRRKLDRRKSVTITVNPQPGGVVSVRVAASSDDAGPAILHPSRRVKALRRAPGRRKPPARKPGVRCLGMSGSPSVYPKNRLCSLFAFGNVRDPSEGIELTLTYRAFWESVCRS